MKKQNLLEKYELLYAKRFSAFRSTHIAKRQVAAAEILGLSTIKISRMERAQSPVDISVISTMVSKFNLNINWLLTGDGPMQLKVENKPTIMTDLSSLKSDMFSMMQAMKYMQHNHTLQFAKLKEQVRLTSEQLRLTRIELEYVKIEIKI